MLTQEQYNKVFPFVWVCKFKNEHNKIVNLRSGQYRFSKEMPDPVPNPEMGWFKPYYEELRKINDEMKDKLNAEKNFSKRR